MAIARRHQALVRARNTARIALLDSLPYGLYSHGLSIYRIQRTDELIPWEDKLIALTIAVARRDAHHAPLRPFDVPEAPCPLCHGVPSFGTNRIGWKIPLGLERHLRGTGKALRCSVMLALVAWAHERAGVVHA